MRDINKTIFALAIALPTICDLAAIRKVESPGTRTAPSESVHQNRVVTSVPAVKSAKPRNTYWKGRMCSTRTVN
uniref:Uncharacterized protein n=1 Tax=Anopheles albimanus TaxID=7167 RepID=A0A182FZ16_ANOAL